MSTQTGSIDDLAVLQDLPLPPSRQTFLHCMQCGSCTGSCPLGPAMEYPPRQLILQARSGKLRKVMESPSLWMCVGCYVCSLRCPRSIELTDALWPALRDRAMQEGIQPPGELQEAFHNIHLYGNSLGKSPRRRTRWAEGLDVPVRDLSRDPSPTDVLWIVGDYPSFYPRNQVVARQFAQILTALEVDWAIVGNKERTLGDCERLYGEEGLFESLVEYHRDLLEELQFNLIVTLDPHGYRALRHYYPRWGVHFPVQHAANFLADRLDQLKPLLTKPIERTITYHDNCCAGRRYGNFDAPRDLLRAIPGVELVEMDHHRETALCCGGGGGGMWLDSHIAAHGGPRLSDQRVREAATAQADILAVSCPFELSRFEDSAKVTGFEDQIQVRDIVELLAQSMDLTSGE